MHTNSNSFADLRWSRRSAAWPKRTPTGSCGNIHTVMIIMKRTTSKRKSKSHDDWRRRSSRVAIYIFNSLPFSTRRAQRLLSLYIFVWLCPFTSAVVSSALSSAFVSSSRTFGDGAHLDSYLNPPALCAMSGLAGWLVWRVPPQHKTSAAHNTTRATRRRHEAECHALSAAECLYAKMPPIWDECAFCWERLVVCVCAQP